MRIEEKRLSIFGQEKKVKIQIFEESDSKKLYKMWKLFLALRDLSKRYKGRSPNMPEVISEGAWCLLTGSVRILSGSSIDTYNEKNKQGEQIKAAIVANDLTSFSPSARWDKLYFLDFSRLDGSFDVYEIPDEELYEWKVNKKQTFKDQQDQGRRPRLSLKELINKCGIKPIYTKVDILLKTICTLLFLNNPL